MTYPTTHTQEEIDRAPWLYKRVGDHYETVTDADFRAALKLAYRMTQFIKDGEDDGDGGTFVMENDDAVDTLHAVISEARAIYAMEQFRGPNQSTE